VYKLQYHKGSEILQVIKQVASSKKDEATSDFQSSIASLQWVESTNSLVFNGSHDVAYDIQRLIKSLDTAQKQVFIEVLVIETDAKEASEFGLEWGASGHFKNKLGLGLGNFSNGPGNLLAQSLQGMSATNTPTGASQIPFGRGFDLGIIGDIIFHRGRSFLSLGSLISALQKDGKISVVLNQKIITQDNKSSSIFVGDNIPFTGSVVQTVGASQQTTANIEYRDIGVSLKITPLLGDSDIITLDINEEITEARDDLRELDSRVNGIQTTKTNMATRVHVPDKHFLVLSGMVKNSKTHRKTGIPCLGGLPWIGAAFSKTKVEKEKKNILVFVRPQIIHSFEDYEKLSITEQNGYNNQLDKKEQVNFSQLQE
jgi:type III secretion protein C